jgi:hypothetical protein
MIDIGGIQAPPRPRAVHLLILLAGLGGCSDAIVDVPDPVDPPPAIVSVSLNDSVGPLLKRLAVSLGSPGSIEVQYQTAGSSRLTVASADSSSHDVSLPGSFQARYTTIPFVPFHRRVFTASPSKGRSRPTSFPRILLPLVCPPVAYRRTNSQFSRYEEEAIRPSPGTSSSTETVRWYGIGAWSDLRTAGHVETTATSCS